MHFFHIKPSNETNTQPFFSANLRHPSIVAMRVERGNSRVVEIGVRKHKWIGKRKESIVFRGQDDGVLEEWCSVLDGVVNREWEEWSEGVDTCDVETFDVEGQVSLVLSECGSQCE